MGRGFSVFLGYFTGGSDNHAINEGSMDGTWIAMDTLLPLTYTCSMEPWVTWIKVTGYLCSRRAKCIGKCILKPLAR